MKVAQTQEHEAQRGRLRDWLETGDLTIKRTIAEIREFALTAMRIYEMSVKDQEWADVEYWGGVADALAWVFGVEWSGTAIPSSEVCDDND